jgi:hypothetical protein
MTRRRLLATAASALLATSVASPAIGAPRTAGGAMSTGDYWTFADTSMAAIAGWWQPDRQVYAPPGRSPSMRTNAVLLTVHAIAALEGHEGPTRDDERARALTARLLRTPPWLLEAPVVNGRRGTCWAQMPDGTEGGAVPVDAKVAQALAAAWQARRALALPAVTVRAIRVGLGRCARHATWRGPSATANQVNWNADVYAAAATVTGRRGPLLGAYRRSLAWFAAHITRPPAGGRTGNLGAGYQFHYLPSRPATDHYNLDTPEYANIVADALRFYDDGLRRGMRPLPRRSVALLRAWVQRLVAGSWTHAGFLNWDTGYGVGRRFSGQYWAFAQQGLLAIATSPAFRSPRTAAWTKAIFDRGLGLYRRFADDAGGPLAPPRLFDVFSEHEQWDAYGARMVLNAVRAAALGLGDRPAVDPPPLYAFDPDTGRLAVTTPRYSTAIVPDNRGAFAYGGIELARLFGPEQRVAANVAGVPPAAFGVVVRDRAGHTLLASQHVRATPLRLRRGRGRPLLRPRAYPARPYAGPFRWIQARGVAERRGARVVSTSTFTAREIRGAWRVRCPGTRCSSVDVLFPTAGEQAVVQLVRRDGAAVALQPGEVAPLHGVVRLALGDGYAVVPTRAPRGARLRLIATRGTAENPHPGPTLAVAVAAGDARRAVFAARIVPSG